MVHWLLLEQEWPGVGRPLFFQKFIHFAKVTTIVTKMFTKFTTKIGDSWNLKKVKVNGPPPWSSCKSKAEAKSC